MTKLVQRWQDTLLMERRNTKISKKVCEVSKFFIRFKSAAHSETATCAKTD